MTKFFSFVLAVFTGSLLFVSCNNESAPKPEATESKAKSIAGETPEYFNLRPKLEKDYGYSHAVKIGDDLKISGAVSMSDSGTIVGAGNMELQMKNCYSDLEKILQHYGYTFDDVVAENIYTTNMTGFIKVSGYRNSIYKKTIPHRYMARGKRTGSSGAVD
ncbi:MAG: RidA family protein [Bacteroidota bacterium]